MCFIFCTCKKTKLNPEILEKKFKLKDLNLCYHDLIKIQRILETVEPMDNHNPQAVSPSHTVPRVRNSY